MSNTNTPYIAKASAQLVNPTTATVFLQAPNALATIAANQTPQAAYVLFKGYVAGAPAMGGVSNFQNVVPFIVRAAGRVTGGTTTNFTPTLQLGRSTTAANNTNLGSLTATPFNTASGSFYLSATLLWDPVSGQINGTVNGFAGSGGTMTNTASAAITPVTGQTIVSAPGAVNSAYSTGEGILFFSVAALFSASNAANVCELDMFEVENL